MAAPSPGEFQRIATNRKAFRDYVVLAKIEAGIELRGTEVKAVRAGAVNLTGGYAQVDGSEAFLHDIKISPYDFGYRFNHDPERPRRLLLHRKEIDRLAGQVALKGHTLIPLSLYLRRGRVKIELGLCKGKLDVDKRETLRRKTADREAERAMARRA